MNKIFDEISVVSQKVYASGWAEANAGNFSVLLEPGEPSLPPDFELTKTLTLPDALKADVNLLISASGSKMDEIKDHPERNTVFVSCLQNTMKVFTRPDGLKDPSSEYLAHLMIQSGTVPEGKPPSAVLHVHPSEVIAITHQPEYCSQQKLNELLWSMQPESVALLPGGIGFVPYLLTGSPELAKATAEKFNDFNVVIWEKHGILARAPHLSSAFSLIEVVVKSLKIFFLCRQAGFEPEGLSQSHIKELRKKFG